eukprot:TRINITY_DN8905_c0_g1_i4.p1 TRINITY_DN8905_c0_g1~~TRINITY_DN8905_c0_g1_i4.p1  ORF type:complete len:492 (+),score=57.46 TRINITY_DN8905_c0_g1_i4:62-1537(+)
MPKRGCCEVENSLLPEEEKEGSKKPRTNASLVASEPTTNFTSDGNDSTCSSSSASTTTSLSTWQNLDSKDDTSSSAPDVLLLSDIPDVVSITSSEARAFMKPVSSHPFVPQQPLPETDLTQILGCIPSADLESLDFHMSTCLYSHRRKSQSFSSSLFRLGAQPGDVAPYAGLNAVVYLFKCRDNPQYLVAVRMIKQSHNRNADTPTVESQFLHELKLYYRDIFNSDSLDTKQLEALDNHLIAPVPHVLPLLYHFVDHPFGPFREHVDLSAQGERFLFTVSPFCQMSLQQLITCRGCGNFSEREVCHVGLGLARGLSYLNKGYIYHCDFKPDNAFLRFPNRAADDVILRKAVEAEVLECVPVVADLGLHLDLRESKDSCAECKPARGFHSGHLAPEITRASGGRVDYAKSDVFSLGITLACMLIPRPFRKDDLPGKIKNRQGFSDALKELLCGLVQIEIAERWDWDTAIERFQSLLAGNNDGVVVNDVAGEV